MAVSFTPNIGLAKPDDTELAQNWVRGPLLQADNNQIMITKTNLPLQSYTPVLIGQTANPNIGAGTIRGEYQDLQGIIMGSFIIEFVDPGVAAGTGEYAVSLPTVVDNVFHTVDTAFGATPGVSSCIGEGYVQDASAVTSSGTFSVAPLTIAGVSYGRLVTETFTGKTSYLVTGAMPMVTATGDKLTGSFIYKKL